MTGRHRGCHWNEQQQRWRVVFRVNGKQKQFGQFRTLEEAQKRSGEVWPTLPIAQRAIRTCRVCGQSGSTSKEFHWNKFVCKQCGKTAKNDSWNKWCRNVLEDTQRVYRKYGRQKEWDRWARMRQVGLINRDRKTVIIKIAQGSVGRCVTWDKWWLTAVKRLNDKMSRRQSCGWTRKTKAWVTSLINREKTRPHKHNCDH